MGTNLKDETLITTLSSSVKFINKSSKIVTIRLYNNKRLFPDFDGGDYIAVNTYNGVGYMYCSSTLYTVSGNTTSNLAFTFKSRDGNIRYVYTKQPNVSESLVTTLTTEVTNYSAITQEDFPCGGAVYVVSCRGKSGNSGKDGIPYYGGKGGSGGAGGNGWNVYFTPSSFWNITGEKSASMIPHETHFDLFTHETYGGGGGGGGGAASSAGYGVGSGGVGGSASPMPPGARVLFPSKTDVLITTKKRAGVTGGAGDDGGIAINNGYINPGNDGGNGGSVSGYGYTFPGETGKKGITYNGGNGGAGATFSVALDIERISYAYAYNQVKGVLSIDAYSNDFSNLVTSTSGVVITKFTAYYDE